MSMTLNSLSGRLLISISISSFSEVLFFHLQHILLLLIGSLSVWPQVGVLWCLVSNPLGSPEPNALDVPSGCVHACRQAHPSTWLSAVTHQTALCALAGKTCTWNSCLRGMNFTTGAMLVDRTSFPIPGAGMIL